MTPPHDNPDDDGLSGWIEVPFARWKGSATHHGADAVVTEEPIEFHVDGEPVATVMRTPGDDGDLARGFFFAEGWIDRGDHIASLEIVPASPIRDASGRFQASNVARLTLAGGAPDRAASKRRLDPVQSSCGVCGKRTVEEVLATLPEGNLHGGDAPAVRFEARQVASFPEKMRASQRLFDRTGALHAAAIVTTSGEMVVVREDIGRHNAVDKALGSQLAAGPLRLRQHALVVSGRVSFEIVQKALRARIPCVVSVSGVSSLAIELARCAGLTVCGFTRDGAVSLYSHPQRVLSS